MTKHSGKCLCGDVQFTTPEIHAIDVCHCNMCQRWGSGGFIGADFFQGGVEIIKDDGLNWYASSDWAKRGFCKNCGSNLFYRLNNNEGFWAISAGTINLPKGHKIGKEIFIDEKPDYYAFTGDQKKLTGAEFFASLQDN